ncbi:MAG: hypothetical protein R3190_06850, partial [Thermoanaerobaculia bacterium]|nr:hypothetical protein [Thermoanaerobaculia bacterium]
MSKVTIVLFGELGLDRGALGVAGAGQALKAATGGDLTAVVVGPAADGMLDGLARLVDRVVSVDDPALAEYQPELVVSALSQVVPGVGG